MVGSAKLTEHSEAVAALRNRYAALPADAPVRLAKATSNLFRFRPRRNGAGLDTADFTRVLHVDPEARVADVGGMTTYVDLVDATLSSGLMPRVVPQLKTITLGGAVAGLGIESSSFRTGLVHESVLELEILTGDGRVVLARPDNEHAALFDGFPNSYGTLGYALRVRIELEPVRPVVALRHIRFRDASAVADALSSICAAHEFDGSPVDFVDGTVFAPDECYLTLGSFADAAPALSDYTGNRIYYRSIRQRTTDQMSVRDYLWRWDTDWFWCSRALGAQHPLVRRLWPKRYLRSDVYRRIVAADRRYRLSARADALRGKPEQEPVIQDIEVPVDRLAEFLAFFHRDIGITPIWLCPLRPRRHWPLYPLQPGELYVNVGFWSSVPLAPGQHRGHHNRLIERQVADLGGRKSLYSDSYYPREEFWRHYNGSGYAALKRAYDPEGRLPDLYDKCVRGQ